MSSHSLFGLEHPTTTGAMWSLIQTLRAQGNDDEAEALVQRLCWLVEGDEESLSARQRTIRDEVIGNC